RRARDERADVHVGAGARLVGAHELEVLADVVGERLREGAEDEVPGHPPPPEARRHRLPELDLAAELAPVREPQRQPAVRRLRPDADERAEVLAVEEPPAGDEVVAAVAVDAALGQLDLVRMVEPEALHGGDVDPRDLHLAGFCRRHSYSATAPAAATFSDSAATGIVASTSRGTAAGSPVRSPPSRKVTGPRRSSAPSGAPPCATSATRFSHRVTMVTRWDEEEESRGTRQIEPADARSAFGEVGSAQPGP